jgi:hypothetical protein
MPRKARIEARGALHHIIFRGIERRRIFGDNKGRDDFIDLGRRPEPWGMVGSQGTRDNHERACRQTGIDATGCEYFGQTR